jgi:adenylosuccinate synthase
MPTNVVVVGVQWGDEGKGKVVDALAEHFDIVARYQGGANAGHTVLVGEKKYVLQLLPTGVIRPDKTAVIGNGVVVDPEALLTEIRKLQEAGTSVDGRLKVSDRAQLILSYHRTHELAAESARGVGKIGTTAKGIGPAYEDKAGRRGLRTCDLRDPAKFRAKCQALVAEKNCIDGALFAAPPQNPEQLADRCLQLGEGILPYLADISLYLNVEMDRGRRVLFEGAQGTLLDIDHGTYPFVTSSSSAAGGACTGTGVGPTRIHAVVGVSKAYATRVGSGPFPTEALGAEGEKIRERGGEYGAVTGRPRRCGWFDVPVARYSARINHLGALVITKLDILDPLTEIPIGVEYECKGKRFTDFPPEIESLEQMKVHYRTVPGWQKPTFGARELSQLPERAQDYLKFLADQVGIRVAMVSTGPKREQCIWLDDAFLRAGA